MTNQTKMKQERIARSIESELALKATFCNYLIPAPRRMNERVIGFTPVDDVCFDETKVGLIATGKSYGHKKGKGEEFFMKWYNTASTQMERVHICSLTGKQCVAKQIVYNNSEHSPSRAFDSRIELECQTRCPSYNGSLRK